MVHNRGFPPIHCVKEGAQNRFDIKSERVDNFNHTNRNFSLKEISFIQNRGFRNITLFLLDFNGFPLFIYSLYQSK